MQDQDHDKISAALKEGGWDLLAQLSGRVKTTEQQEQFDRIKHMFLGSLVDSLKELVQHPKSRLILDRSSIHIKSVTERVGGGRLFLYLTNTGLTLWRGQENLGNVTEDRYSEIAERLALDMEDIRKVRAELELNLEDLLVEVVRAKLD